MQRFVAIIPLSLVGLSVVVASYAGVRARQHQLLMQRCEENIYHLRLLPKMFANKNKGKWPKLDPRFGYFSPDADQIVSIHDKILPTSRGDICNSFVSPARFPESSTPLYGTTDHKTLVTDDSYWYFPYPIRNEALGLEYIKAYKAIYPTEQKFYWWKLELLSGRIRLEQDDIIRGRLRFYLGTKVELVENVYGVEKANPRYIPDYDSQEEFWKASAADRRSYPGVVFVERPSIHGSGGHVAYHDGFLPRVEFVKYPGKFPMTKKFIAALESLDELKKLNIVRTNPN